MNQKRMIVKWRVNDNSTPMSRLYGYGSNAVITVKDADNEVENAMDTMF